MPCQRSSRWFLVITLLGSAALLMGPATAGELELGCKVEGNTVHLNWTPLDPDAAGNFQAVLERDGEVIAQLEPGDTAFEDRDVAPGVHVYRLVVFGPDGVARVAECEVVVEGEPGVQCTVDGNIVTVRWTLPDDIPALGFVVSRDGEQVAVLGPDARSYREEAPPGEHVYTVTTNNTFDPAVPPDFLIGQCVVFVEAAGTVECSVEGNVVTVRWEVSADIFARGFIVARDGQIVAELGPDARMYREEAPAGEHTYTVSTNNRPAPDFLIGQCVVFVEGGFGIECKVEGNVVSIFWEFPIDIAIRGFIVLRDGTIVAEVGPDALSYTEEAPPGEHTYSVFAIQEDPSTVAGRIFVGSCRVVVEGGFGIECVVEGNIVHIAWEFPIDIAIDGFIVLRDGERVAELGPNARSYREEAPPGEHTYSVFAVLFDPTGVAVTIFVGSCRVVVDGGLPAPQDLRCAVAESFPVQVQLFWTNPVRYDAIIIVRDGERIALLEGDATRFSELDPGPGRHVYAVSGLRDGVQSRPATCVVEIEGPRPNRLFLVNPDLTPIGGVDGGGAMHADTLIVGLHNGDPVQGWSFGVCSDPAVVTVAAAGIEGTDTAGLNDGEGPSFLAINLLDQGLTMAVVIDEEDPADVLPPANRYDLLRIRYEPGPDAVAGEPYRVSFCAELGEPPVAVVLVVAGQSVVPSTSPGTVVFSGFQFLRADANDDGVVDMSDGMFTLNWLFLSGPVPPCLDAADANGSRDCNIADPIYTFQRLFAGGPPPPPPYPRCGSARLVLGCEESSCNATDG